MKRLLTGALALALLAGTAGVASADDRRNDGYRDGGYQNNQDYRGDRNQYNNRGARWAPGQRISQRDWYRGRPVNYRDYNLKKAPRGYEWREFGGTYIQAQRTGGYINAVVVLRNDDGRYGNGHRWRRGERIDRSDWDRGRRVDYREYNLSQPPSGYEWREVDGDYVQAQLLGGLIAAVIESQQRR